MSRAFFQSPPGYAGGRPCDYAAAILTAATTGPERGAKGVGTMTYNNHNHEESPCPEAAITSRRDADAQDTIVNLDELDSALVQSLTAATVLTVRRTVRLSDGSQKDVQNLLDAIRRALGAAAYLRERAEAVILAKKS